MQNQQHDFTESALQLTQRELDQLRSQSSERSEEFNRLLYRYQQVSAAKTQSDAAKERVSQLESLSSQQSTELTRAEAKVLSLESELQKIAEDRDSKLTQAQFLFDHAEQRLLSQHQKISDLEREISAVRNERDTVGDHLRRSQSQARDISKKSRELRRELKGFKASVRVQLQELQRVQMDSLAVMVTKFVDLLRSAQAKSFESQKSK